jgi:hypothetical protein
MDDTKFNFKMIYINDMVLQVFKDGRIRKQTGGCSHYKKGINFVKGTKDARGYNRVLINNQSLCVHRIIAHTFLNYPITSQSKHLVIDHIDRNKKNNNLSNLRLLTQKQNTQNNCKNGVYKVADYYVADLTIFDKRIKPRFETEQEAKEWRNKVKSIMLLNIDKLS